ncbi:MAG TPA: ATP-binding protein [Trichormus sp.]
MPTELQSIRILLIEDHVVFSKAVTAMISLSTQADARVVVANRLNSGLLMLTKENFDLVLLDLNLPDSHGITTLVKVREQSPKAPIVVLTGHDDERAAIEALSLGAQDYLVKGDVNARQLNRTISYAIERKKLQSVEAERLRLYEQREDFMATLTHDLKNPLIGANRLLESITKGHVGEISPDIRDLLLVVHEGNAALLNMICNLLEVYRYEKDIHTLIRENTDLAKLIRKYLTEAEPLIQQRGLKLETQIVDSPSPVFADQNAILRVVQNLIDNAIKFSPEGGLVTVKLWQDQDEAVLEVSDNGPGVAEEDKFRLFQRFWQGRMGRLHSAGTGLGLYLSRQIVEAHEGRIKYSSNDREGAIFTVSLPLVNDRVVAV